MPRCAWCGRRGDISKKPGLDHSVSSLSAGRISKDVVIRTKGASTRPKPSISCQNLIISEDFFSCHILIKLGKELAINFCIIISLVLQGHD